MKPIYDPLLGKMRTELTAGAGLDISGGTISTITPPDGVPYIGGDGVAIDGATIYADLTGLDRIEIDGGTITYNPIKDIVTVSGSAVTLNPDTAYKIQATTQAVTLNANVPASGKWGLDGHAEIFVAGTGYVVTGANVVLATPLEPDAVNNCTLRFHDGLCIISVEDHVAGYIVVSATGTTSGSLPYGISSASQEYIAFDASLNGTTIDLSGSTANGEKHVVGNSYNDTILTGSVDCGTSKFTVANLALQDVVVGGGTMTLGDAFIPSGSTVAVSGGGLAVENVTGNGGVIDLGGTNVFPASGSVANAGGVVITGGSASNGGAFYVSSATLNMSGCTVSGNTGTTGAGIYGIRSELNISSSVISGNISSGQNGKDIYTTTNATLRLTGCTVGTVMARASRSELIGSNVIGEWTGEGSMTLTSGAILDLTGNTNATPINPGGGITFEPGGATVLYSSGAVSGSYSADRITACALGNDGTIKGNSSTAAITGFTNGAVISGAVLTGGTSYYGGVGRVNTGSAVTFESCTFSGNKSTNNNYWNAMGVTFNGKATFSNCTFDYATSQCIALNDGGTVTIIGTDNVLYGIRGYTTSDSVIISSGASINLTSSINPGGGIQVVGGTCMVNGNAIESGTYTSIDSNGTPTE